MATNYNKLFDKDYEKLSKRYDETNKENKLLKLRLEIAESEAQRYKDKVTEVEDVIKDKDNIIKALEDKVIELQRQLEIANYDKDYYKSKTLNDGTNSGIPTSQTPINKKKKIPNTREKTGKLKGGQKNHPKNKLEKFDDSEINEHVDIVLNECPYCNSRDYEELNTENNKDEFDYYIKIIKRRNHFKERRCKHCGKIFRTNIPDHLKEDNQYGSNVQATVLTLANVGNVAINKIKRIICGLTSNEINMSEGYISKLQKRGSQKLGTFINDLKFYLTKVSLLYWDDTVVMINTKRACMRFYGNEYAALYCAHEHKNKEGLDEDNILKKLTCKTIVEHDHLTINYNKEYSFVNAECCQHLIRDLEKVSTYISNRTWSKKLKELFQEYDHKRNELIKENKDRFTDEEFDLFMTGINEILLLGVDEHIVDDKVYYADTEQALLLRLMEYRDNYIYWMLDFDLPFTNNVNFLIMLTKKTRTLIKSSLFSFLNSN